MRDLTHLSSFELEQIRPAIVKNATVRRYEDETLVWSPWSPRPTVLDGVSSVVFQVLDGTATVADLIADVHDVVGVPVGVARSQIRQVLTHLNEYQLLDSFSNARAIPTKMDFFPAPPNP